MEGIDMDFSVVAKRVDGQIRPPETPILDLDCAKRDLSPYREQIANMVKEAMALIVDNDESNTIAVELGTSAKKLNKTIEIEKKRIIGTPQIQEVLDFVKSFKNFCKGFQDDLVKVENITKQKVGTYGVKVELNRLKTEEAARKAVEELQRKIDKEAKKTGVEAPKIETPVIPEPPKVTRTDSGTSHIRKDWTFEIIDHGNIPREYMKVDEQAIRQAIKAGIREIAGVRIYQETKTVFRS